jgi:hypothetical protein
MEQSGRDPLKRDSEAAHAGAPLGGSLSDAKNQDISLQKEIERKPGSTRQRQDSAATKRRREAG